MGEFYYLVLGVGRDRLQARTEDVYNAIYAVKSMQKYFVVLECVSNKTKICRGKEKIQDNGYFQGGRETGKCYANVLGGGHKTLNAFIAEICFKYLQDILSSILLKLFYYHAI